MENTKNYNLYGVSQSCHGHEYRFIFTEEEILEDVDPEFLIEDEAVDILFPIGGSNSSATVFTKLTTLEGVRAFLTSPADGPDLDDPMLVDIAEYLLTIDTNEGCAGEFLEKLGLKAEDLTQYDDVFNHRQEAEKMVEKLIEWGCPEIDAENPFYGDSEDLRFSELCDLYEEYLQKMRKNTLELYPFKAEYEDFTLAVSNFMEGSSAYVYYPNVENPSGEGTIVKVFRRSDNPDRYDEMSDAFIFSSVSSAEDYDVSGEFVFDSNSFYVFIKMKGSEKEFSNEDEAREYGKNFCATQFEHVQIDGNPAILCGTNQVYEDSLWSDAYKMVENFCEKFAPTGFFNDSADFTTELASEIRDLVLQRYKEATNTSFVPVAEDY